MSGLACGKVILLGEHAVVYGVPAIVVGIDRGASAHATRIGGDRGASELLLHAQGLSDGALPLRTQLSDDTDLARAFARLLEASHIDNAVRVEARTDLPVAAGLGCSAALGVALARALAEVGAGVRLDVETVVERAMAWERVFHGNPSGVDAAAAARGGCLLYRREAHGPVLTPLALTRPLALAVGHTGVASSTRTMVEHIATLREQQPSVVADAFNRIRSLVPVARDALEHGDTKTLGRAMNENQAVLASLGLSTPQTEDLCGWARESGAIGAKLTGSGGGGCVVGLAERDPESIVARWQAQGFRAFSTLVRPAQGLSESAQEAK